MLTMMNITSTENAMLTLYGKIDSDVRDYIWGGCNLDDEYTPYREKIFDADHKVKEVDADPAMTDSETGYSTGGERLTEKIVDAVTRELLPLIAKKHGIPDLNYINPVTGSIAPLSEWVCDFMESTPETWGGTTFDAAGLEEAD